jgi:hypothetical protein
MVVWVAADSLEKRVLEFDWHQVARKSLAASLDSGRNHGPDQRKGFASVETSLVKFPINGIGCWAFIVFDGLWEGLPHAGPDGRGIEVCPGFH